MKSKIKIILDFLELVIFVLIPIFFYDEISKFLVPEEFENITVSSPMGFLLCVGLITTIICMIMVYKKLEDFIISRIKDK